MQIETTANWTTLLDWYDKKDNGTRRNSMLIAAIMMRPVASAIKTVFWYDRPLLRAKVPHISLSVWPLWDIRQKRNARKYRWSRRWNGSCRDRGPRSTLTSLVLYISYKLRSFCRLHCLSSSNKENVSIDMTVLKAISDSSIRVLLVEITYDISRIRTNRIVEGDPGVLRWALD